MKTTDQVRDDIVNYIDEFKSSSLFSSWKKADQKIYEDENLRPFFLKKTEIEKNLSYLTKGSEEYLNQLKEYTSLIDQINKVDSVKEYYLVFDEILQIKKIIENNLLLELLK